MESRGFLERLQTIDEIDITQMQLLGLDTPSLVQIVTYYRPLSTYLPVRTILINLVLYRRSFELSLSSLCIVMPLCTWE